MTAGGIARAELLEMIRDERHDPLETGLVEEGVQAGYARSKTRRRASRSGELRVVWRWDVFCIRPNYRLLWAWALALSPVPRHPGAAVYRCN